MGDGVLAYFGFPRAHEEDAERAVYALAWKSRRSWQARNPSEEELEVRIGIATGIVVVGEPVGQGSAQEQAVVGETPNLAARLQALAEPGSAYRGGDPAAAGRRLRAATSGRNRQGFDRPVPAWASCARRRTSAASRRAVVGMTPSSARGRKWRCC